MAKAKTLKDSDDAVIYPVSKSNLVYRADNTTTVEGALSSIEAAIDKSLVKDFSLDSNPSTTTVVLDKTYQNIKTGAGATGTVTFPVASASQAGVMNSSTFETIQDNADKIQAILNGSVAVEGLSANVSQPELTAAWKDATGRTELFNQASIYDVTNKKVWTYYDNEGIWRFVNAEGSVSVSQFTNSSLGTIKGSETDGQVFAETDGTGSVNGWDTMTNQVSTNTSNIANEVTNRTNAVNDLQEQINGKANAGDVHNGTLTINHNGEQKVAFSANTSIDSTISIDGVTSSDVISTESVTPIVTTGLIVDGAVTKSKIADYSVDNLKLADNSITPEKINKNSFASLGMVGFMSIKAKEGYESVNTEFVFSGNETGTKTLNYEYDPLGCIELSQGTCLYTHKQGVEIIEVEVTLTGLDHAFWLQTTNGDPLNGAVYIANRVLLSKDASGYGGATFRVFFDVSGMSDGDSVYLNPTIRAYGGSVAINRAGTEGGMTVKVFGRG